MARPKLAHERRKTRTIIFRVTKADYVRLERLAKEAHMPVNQFARDIVLAGSENVVFKTVPCADPVLVKHLHYIGHNLNQLVKNAHIFGRVSPRVEDLCLRIDRLVDEATAKEWHE